MISVVIPVYNSMEHIGECLASLEKQKGPSFEIVLVDDGSIDGSGSYCDSYAEKRENVKVIHQENGGQQAARAIGIKNATGDYVSFLDSDDCLRFDAIMRISEAIDEDGPDIVCFDFSRGEIEAYEEGSLGSKVLAPGIYIGQDYTSVYAALCSGNFNNLCTKTVRKELALDALGSLGECSSLRHAEDLYFLIQIVRKAKSLLCLADVLYFYRQNPDSITSVFASSQIDDLDFVFSALIKCASKWGREYVLDSKEAVVKHLLWSLMSLADSDCSTEEKRRYTNCIAREMTDICGEDMPTVIARLRLDFKIPVKLLLAGHKKLAMSSSKIISRLAEIANS